jgi:hypothetical protein
MSLQASQFHKKSLLTANAKTAQSVIIYLKAKSWLFYYKMNIQLIHIRQKIPASYNSQVLA